MTALSKSFFRHNSLRDPAYFFLFCSVEEFAPDERRQREEKGNQEACVSKVQDAHDCKPDVT